MDLADAVFVTKGVLSVIGVVILTIHINASLPYMPSKAQRLRYILLLGYGVTVASASTEQLYEHAELESRHWMSLALSFGLVAVALYSMYEEKQKRQRP